MQLNARDVSSEYCQRITGIIVERLDKYDSKTGQWRECILEDRHPGPEETAAAKIDIANWFRDLSPRDREIATCLASGHTTGEVAKRFGLSPSRISQKRREYLANWRSFQREQPAIDGG